MFAQEEIRIQYILQMEECISKNCDLIGGTDYIYGDATAVFDNCKLGAEGYVKCNVGGQQ